MHTTVPKLKSRYKELTVLIYILYLKARGSEIKLDSGL